MLGIFVTAMLAWISNWLGTFSYLQVVGAPMLAILLGMSFRTIVQFTPEMLTGSQFASKTLLRLGIVLLGIRFDFSQLITLDSYTWFSILCGVLFALLIVISIGYLFKLNKNVSLLVACGTAICGAAAVGAIAPQIRAKQQEAAIGVATVALLGTIFTLSYTILYPWLGLTNGEYGLFAGATLHEVAHVVAATQSHGSKVMDLAILVKLIRVLCLIPLSILLSLWFSRKSAQLERISLKKIPMPWFVFGFLLVGMIHSWIDIPSFLTHIILSAAYFFIAMAMAGLGLQVEWSSFRKLGGLALLVGMIGSLLFALFFRLIIK